MKYCKIKGLKKEVSRVALGTGWFAPEYEADIFELLDTYVDQGGNVIDAGRFYNGGKSEAVIAKWLKHRKNRDDLIIVNKACHHFVDENNIHHPEKNRVGAPFITEDLDYSLNNMAIDYFDLYILHRDNPKVPVAELMDRLEKHRKEGKITAYGVSNWSLERINEAQAYCQSKNYQGITVNSPSFTLAAVKKPRWVGTVYVDAHYVAKNNAKGITVMSWGAQGAGFFIPLWNSIHEEAPQDIREAFFTEENFEKLDRVKQLAAKKNVEPVNIALAYVLNERFEVLASIGPRNKQELLSSLNVENVQLTPSELLYLELKG